MKKNYVFNSKIIAKKAKDLAFDALFKDLPMAFYWMNNEGYFLGGNEIELKILGLSSLDELIGKHSNDFATYEAWENSKKVIETGQRLIFEEVHTEPDGKQVFFLSLKSPLYDEENNIVGLLGVSVDITDRKQAEEREKLALAKASEALLKAKIETELRQAVMILTGSIVHDLRSPIASVAMDASSIQKYWPALINVYRRARDAQLPIENNEWEMERTLKLLEKVGENLQGTAHDMREFVNVTLKTLSKALGGTLTKDDFVTCSMWHCIHNTLTRYPFTEEERALVHFKSDTDFKFLGNEILMIRVLSNLLNNALHQIRKHTHGEIFIALETGDTFNQVSFKDTAGGAPPEIIAHLFDGYRTTKKEGTGVGLAFCKITLENFGGAITSHSVYGDYIEFVLTLPKIEK